MELLTVVTVLPKVGDVVVVSAGSGVNDGWLHVKNLERLALGAMVKFILLVNNYVVGARAVREKCVRKHKKVSK